MRRLPLLLLIFLAFLFNLDLTAQPFGDRLEMNPDLAPFYHGVASGDPTTDRVIIWTRVTTEETQVDGIWRMATDSLFTENVKQGFFSTNADRDYTVKVDVTGLNADTWYFYEFEALAKRSLRGRTKTLPATTPEQYRIAFVSCNDMNIGYFNIFERIKERNDIEVVYHLGDYIYEYEDTRYFGTSIYVRELEPEYEILTLSDYRTRYSFYRLDPKLSELHQQYPFVMLWDDHETANDSWKNGAENHSPGWEGPWEDRKSAAVQAYKEWMPIREKDGDPYDISRSYQVGDLAEFYLLETRLYKRDRQNGVATLYPNLDIGDRVKIGPQQRNWFTNGMKNTSAQWKIMVSPTTFSTLFSIENFRNGDYWDGYPWERKQILNFIANENIKNFVAISGDVHTAFAFDIPQEIQNPTNLNFYNPETREGSIGVNFVGTAASSGLCCRRVDVPAWEARNPHMHYINNKQNGYCILDITPDKITCDYFYADTIHIEDDTSHFWEASMCVEDSIPYVITCGAPTIRLDTLPALAPSSPRPGGDSIFVNTAIHYGDILGLYPNPAKDVTGVQFFLQDKGTVHLHVYDTNGKLLRNEWIGNLPRGVHFHPVMLSELPSAEYIITLVRSKGEVIASRKLIKQ